MKEQPWNPERMNTTEGNPVGGMPVREGIDVKSNKGMPHIDRHPETVQEPGEKDTYKEESRHNTGRCKTVWRHTGMPRVRGIRARNKKGPQ